MIIIFSLNIYHSIIIGSSRSDQLDNASRQNKSIKKSFRRISSLPSITASEVTNILKLPLIDNHKSNLKSTIGGSIGASGGGDDVKIDNKSGYKSVNFNLSDTPYSSSTKGKSTQYTMGNYTATTTTTTITTNNNKNNNDNNNRTNKNMMNRGSMLPTSFTNTSSELTNDLIQSLKQMQKHTNMIKHAITSSQSTITITNDNNKAKQLVFIVAAEQLKLSFQPFFIYELRRGFLSWRIMIHQIERKEKAQILIRFLTIRNIILGLNKLMLKVLTIKMRQWKQYTIVEAQRLKKLKILNAAICIQCLARKRRGKKCFIVMKYVLIFS